MTITTSADWPRYIGEFEVVSYEPDELSADMGLTIVPLADGFDKKGDPTQP